MVHDQTFNVVGYCVHVNIIRLPCVCIDLCTSQYKLIYLLLPNINELYINWKNIPQLTVEREVARCGNGPDR